MEVGGGVDGAEASRLSSTLDCYEGWDAAAERRTKAFLYCPLKSPFKGSEGESSLFEEGPEEGVVLLEPAALGGGCSSVMADVVGHEVRESSMLGLAPDMLGRIDPGE